MNHSHKPAHRRGFHFRRGKKSNDARNKYKTLTIALAGNANVGKSTIFNQLTSSHQTIGNWPGKTVERAEGILYFKGWEIRIIDLPGIYSLSTYTLEEEITREFIAINKPDLIISVIDASALERNLYLSLQLLELKAPLIIALNQVDLATKKGVSIDHKKLQEILGIPVIPVIAIKGTGIFHLIEASVKLIVEHQKRKGNNQEFDIPVISYGKECEDTIEELTRKLQGLEIPYPPRWLAIKLLEDDGYVINLIQQIKPELIAERDALAKQLEETNEEVAPTIVAMERYNAAHRIVLQVEKMKPPEKLAFTERLDNIILHPVLGYPIMAAFLMAAFFSIFIFGDFFSGILTSLLETLEPPTGNVVLTFIWNSLGIGLIAGITIVLPYLIPFYILLGFLEDSGYLARIAFLTDNIMHHLGLHGKACIPLMLGYGCNVPACLGCRIMETDRERFSVAFLSTLVPCAARIIVILGVVGTFVGFSWAVLLFVLNLGLIFILGKFTHRVLPGESVGLIMEIPPYRVPSFEVLFKQTWFRLKDFIYLAFPLIIIGSLLIEILRVLNLLTPIGILLSPIMMGWLGLPNEAGITLIFGILRKELTLTMLASLGGTTNFAAFLSPVQMLVFGFVTMLYIPCIATIAALWKELGWRRALFITIFDIALAIVLGGLMFRLLTIFPLL